MPARFTATAHAFEKGVESIKPAAAVKLIEDWETSLKDVEVPGAKGIVRDLEALKKALAGDAPDGEKIKSLMGKLADATTRIAGHVTDNTKDKIEELGTVLKSAA
ncbi:MAG: hypothetical protein ACRYG4_21555 [Janthinobacterium lividum]